MTINRQNKNMRFPRIRSGIDVVFNDYDHEGKPQWVIHDSGRNKFFLIGWVEYEILQRWKLGSIDEIIDRINKETTLSIESHDVENFFDFLKRNYLIEMSGYEIHKQANDQHLFKTDNWISWLISNYLFFRIPLVQPDDFLTKTRIVAKIMFSRYLAYIMMVLATIGLYQLSGRWDDFTHTFASVFTLRGMLFAMGAFVIIKLCHELGHAYMCKSYGIPVPTLGLAFLVFWPVLYTDTTLSWALNNKERLRIAAAGVWMETYVVIIALLIWCNTDNQTLKTICYVTITVNWIASILINVSPFMRFDGYYIFADLLKMPNLSFRAFALTRWQIRRVLFGWNDPPPEKFTKRMHYLLVIYSIFTWIYRLIIYFGIALLVYHFFAKVVGIILFLIEIYFFILGPFFSEFQYWYANRSKFSFNLHTKISLSILGILFILFILPFKHSVEFPSTLSYTHQFLYSPEAGILETPIPPNGTEVKANQPIAVINSKQLNQALFETQLEYEKTVSQLRRSAVNQQYIGEKNILLSDIKKLRSEYQRLLKLQDRLVLKVPFNGILVESDHDLHPGTYVMKDQWIADIIKPNSLVIEAFVSQIDINNVQIGSKGFFYAHDLSVPAIPVRVISIETLQSRELECRYSPELKQNKNEQTVIETPCYNASELGGEIPAYQSDKGGFVPTLSVYRVILHTDNDVNLRHVERGNVILESKARSYAYLTFYKFKSIFIEQFGF